MKKAIAILITFFCPLLIWSQSWNAGGNPPFPPAVAITPANNFLGTNSINNIPVRFVTNGVTRMRLMEGNGVTTTTVNLVPKLLDGYVGIGTSNYFGNINNNPISMLHLHGPNNSGFFGDAGWRRWMNTGTFYSENSDGMYVGMKSDFFALRANKSKLAVC